MLCCFSHLLFERLVVTEDDRAITLLESVSHSTIFGMMLVDAVSMLTARDAVGLEHLERLGHVSFHQLDDLEVGHINLR